MHWEDIIICAGDIMICVGDIICALEVFHSNTDIPRQCPDDIPHTNNDVPNE